MLANESTDLLATSIGLEETCDKAEPVGRILGLRLEVIFFSVGVLSLQGEAQKGWWPAFATRCR